MTGLVAILADLGVTTTLTRELAKAPEDADRLGGDLLRFRLASSIIAAFSSSPSSRSSRTRTTPRSALAISLATMVFTILGGFPAAFFQANLRQEYTAAIDVATRVLGLAAIVLVRVFDLGLYGLVGLLVVVNGLACVWAFSLSRRFWRINIRFRWSRARGLLGDSVVIGLVSMIGLLHFRGDAVLLSLMKPARDVGIYAIAYRFVDQAFMLPGLFVGTMFPIITRAIHEDAARAQRAINRTFQTLLLGAIAVTVLIFVLAHPLVHLVAGTEFDASIRPLRILAFALPFIFVAPVFYNVLVVINRQRRLILIGAASLAVNVGLNLILIPRYSYNGAASATVVSEGLCAPRLRRGARPLRLPFREDLPATGPRATAAAAGVVALMRSESPWLAVALAELAFLAAAYALRAVTRADLQVILRTAPPDGT